MDYNLGPSNGLEIAKTIITRYPAINIILISGNMNKTLENQAFTTGIKACFSKPFVLEDFLKAIKCVIEESNLRCA
jgi:CheY-like chemotaxis protein